MLSTKQGMRVGEGIAGWGGGWRKGVGDLGFGEEGGGRGRRGLGICEGGRREALECGGGEEERLRGRMEVDE